MVPCSLVAGLIPSFLLVVLVGLYPLVVGDRRPEIIFLDSVSSPTPQGSWFTPHVELPLVCAKYHARLELSSTVTQHWLLMTATSG